MMTQMAPRRRAFLLAAALTLALGTVPAEALEPLPVPGVTGPDDRTLVDTGEYPWSAIGRVNNTLGPFCTGTLVAPRRVLTAAHCLWNPRTGAWLPPSALHFLAGYRRGGYLGHSLVADYTLSGCEAMRRRGPPSDPAEDWAVLTLAEDLGAAAAPVPTAPLDRGHLRGYRRGGGVFLQAGYSRDRPHILTRNRPCPLSGFAGDERVVLHACDATFGDSGSPILLERDNGYHLVGMLVGIDRKTGRGIAVTGKVFHERLHNICSPDATAAHQP